VSFSHWLKGATRIRFDDRRDALGRRARPRVPVMDRFWAFVAQGDGCWEWTGYIRPDGYGQFGVDRSIHERAHRMAYQLTAGPIPKGIDVCHRCDNPACVRPDHLFLGTRSDNMRDMVAKGRGRKETATHCHRGHDYSTENTARDPRSGKRRCRTCHAITTSENRGKYDRSKYETPEYRRASYLRNREATLAAAKERYHRQKEAA
jgi:hypothetical protein